MAKPKSAAAGCYTQLMSKIALIFGPIPYVTLCIGLALTACDPVPDGEGTLVGSTARVMELSPSSLLAPDADRPLVTPRWTASGVLLASGRQGRDLYRVDAVANRVELVHPDLRTGRHLFGAPDGQRVAFFAGAADHAEVWEVDLDTGAVQRLTSRPAFVPPTDRLSDGAADAVALGRLGGQELLFEPLRGRLVRLAGNDGEQVIADAEAWGVALSPDGRFVAYCRGHLVDAHLFLAGADGETIDLGAGVHPSWAFGGAALVYSVPEVLTSAATGRRELVGAELHAYGVRQGRRAQLTDTPGVTEMQSAVSPHSRQLVYADWASGHIAVADIVAPEGQGGER